MRRRLQEARLSLGMTQSQMAKHLGIQVQAYQRIEYGTRVGRVEMWDKLEDMFGIHQRKLREELPPR